MTCAKRISALLGALFCLANCTPKASVSNGDSGSCANATIGAAASLQTTSTTNTIAVYIADTSTTGDVGYPNEPLVSVTLCTPNHTSPSQCTTVSNILIDTGSFGLRVFASAIPSNVQPMQQTVVVNSSTYNLAELEQFGTGADWGGVANVDVTLGNQTVQNIPIQVINNGLPIPASLATKFQPDTDPCHARYNGIMGVGPFIEDCGADCNNTDTNVNPGSYFACTASSCGDEYTGSCPGGNCAVTVTGAQQVSNPVALMASPFNNGLSLTFPSVGPLGANGLQGTMTMGIGAAAGNGNNSGATVYLANPAGMTDGTGMDFITTFNGTQYGFNSSNSSQSFIDSGSNGIFFPQQTSGAPPVGTPALCSDGSGLYCPANPISYSGGAAATVAGYNVGSPTTQISFIIGNAETLFNAGATASGEMGGDLGSGFDWGLPFFFGRTVWVGFDSQSAAGYANGTKTGPYWGF